MLKYIRDLCGGIVDFKKGYWPRNNMVKDEKGDLVTDSHRILARCRNYFSQLLNACGVNDVRETEIHTAEPLVPEPSACEIEFFDSMSTYTHFLLSICILIVLPELQVHL